MKMTGNRLAMAALLGVMFGPADQAQIKHIEMRVEGMT
jgi:hypothetical protein